MTDHPIQRVAVVGATGYAGQEAVALLAAHPHFQLAEAMGSRAGQAPDRPALPVDRPVAPLDLDWLGENADAVLLGTPHGASAELAVACLERGLTVVDMSADFRLKDPATYATHYGQEHPAPGLLPEAVYGLTEWCRDDLPGARLVACPGCYPTSVLLPLKPLLADGLLAAGATIIADSKSGASGAGRAAKARTHFGAVHDNFLAYGVGTHRHTPEIHQEAGVDTIRFVPHLLPVFRGILTTLYVTPATGVDADGIRRALATRYKGEPFVRVFDRGLPELDRVAGTNECHIAVAPMPGGTSGPDTVVVIAAIDNLVKGAAGQAIQNLNCVAGRPETEGLTLTSARRVTP